MAIIVSLSEASTSETQIYVRSTFSSGGTQAVRAKFYKSGSYQGDKTFSATTSTTQYFLYTGLSASTSYSLSVQYLDATSNVLGSDSITSSTDNPPPPPDTTSPSLNFSTPTGSSITSTSIYAYASATDNVGMSYFQFLLNGVNQSTVYVSGTSASANYTFTGLTEGVEYTLKVNAVDTSSNSTSITRYATTLTGRPADWLWTTANDVNGNKIAGADYRMGNNEWNDFTTIINEFLVYKGFGTTTFTQAIFDGTFYATRFNEAKNAIGGMNTTGITNRITNDDVNAYLFNILKTKLNEL